MKTLIRLLVTGKKMWNRTEFDRFHANYYGTRRTLYLEEKNTNCIHQYHF